MMVKETRYIFEVGEIVAFKLRCGTCEGEISTKLGDMAGMIECPLCGTTWEHPTRRSAVRDVLRSLANLCLEKDPTRIIRFEIDGEEDKRPQS